MTTNNSNTIIGTSHAQIQFAIFSYNLFVNCKIMSTWDTSVSRMTRLWTA